MKFKSLLKLFAVFSLLVTVFFIFSGISGKGEPQSEETFDADGKGMVSIVFNKQNVKSLKVKCLESERETEDKLLMKEIEAEIFKKGKMNKDIKVTGSKGSIENNFHNFQFSDNARISSEDLLLTSEKFDLFDRAILTTRRKVDYKVKQLKGKALKGMRLNLEKNILFLYRTSGVYSSDGDSFNFKTKTLKFEDSIRTLRMLEDNSIDKKGTRMKGNRIVISFAEEYKNVAEISAWGDCYYYVEKEPGAKEKQFNEIKAAHIQSLYDESGKLKESHLKQGVSIKLKNKSNKTNISSNQVDIFYDTKTGYLKDIKIPASCKVRNRGKSDFNVSAYKMDLDYNDKGELSVCKSRGKSTFKIDDYRGETFLMIYDVENDLINLKGRDSKVFYKKNTFESSRFKIHTAKKKLKSSVGVKSIIALEKNNVLFSKDLIYINSQKINVDNKDNTFYYKEDVELRQKETLLTANELKIDENDNLSASGKVSLSFINKDEDVKIKGKEITLDSQTMLVTITERAIIKSGDNVLKADSLKIGFNNQNEITDIYGNGNVNFINEDTQGRSKKVHWLFAKEEIIFNDDAMIERKEKGATRGKELHFFLKDNRITVASDASKRTETKRDKK